MSLSSVAVLDAPEFGSIPTTARNAGVVTRWQSKKTRRSTWRVEIPVAKTSTEYSFAVAAEGNLTFAYRATKRAIDLVGAAAVLVALSPVMLATLVVLSITTKGRPLYSQPRAGYRGQPFRMWKFRTMRAGADRIQHTVANEADGPVFKNRRDPRITRLGRYLRKFSIDETPQLFSVLAGKMSLVGPRPLPIHEMANVEPWQRRRLAVRPGLTCLWQVSGRSNIGFHDWAKMDVWYVENQGLWTDLKLIVKTPLTVITGKGAY